MLRSKAALVVFVLPFLLFACARSRPVEPKSVEHMEPEISEEMDEKLLDAEDLVTRNVVYTGILEEGGVTIYQQGTHRLMLSDGKMVLLESDTDIVFDLYVGKLVHLRGDVMPTVEAGGTLMNVQEIGWIRREEDDNGVEKEVVRVLCGGEAGGTCPGGFICELAEEVGVCVESKEEDVEGIEVIEGDEEEEEGGGAEEVEGIDDGVEEDEEEDAKELEDQENEEEVEGVTEMMGTEDMNEAMQLMVDEDYAAERWTQEYCSSHVEFCIPVHKNWYFKSFGATSSLLWHVEMGAVPVDNFGDGPLTVDLKTGDLSTLGVSDGAVKRIGTKVIGYREWTDNRHFEISAVAALSEPVIYVTGELGESE